MTAFFKRVYSRINRARDLPANLLHPEFTLRFPPEVEFLGAVGTMRGPDSIGQMFSELEQGLSEIQWIPEQVQETSDGRILAFVRMEAAGETSKVPLREAVAIIASLDAGRVTEADMYVDRAEALKAAGLSE